MKTLKTVACLAILFVCMTKASAQEARIPLNAPNYSKPRLFAGLPEKMPLKVKDVASLLELPVGAPVNATLTAGFPLIGTIVSKSDPSDTTVKSVVIRTNHEGSTFTFSRVTAIDGTTSYIGRLFSRNGGDALEVANEGGSYILRKKGINDLVNE